MCLWWQRQWRTHGILCSTSTSPPKQQKNWRISSKSLPCPNIAVNQSTSSRMSRLGGGWRIIHWRGYNFYERQSAIMWLTILMIWILSISHMKSGNYLSGRNHPRNNGILAAHTWGEVYRWFSHPSGNLHHLSIILASYCICWKWSTCEKANRDPLEWLQ
jgi:hypothetical protein